MKCLTFVWRFRGVIAVAATVIALTWTGGRMFSPGYLNHQNHSGNFIGGIWTHADLASNCSACHASIWSGSTMANRCLECHIDVQRQVLGGEPLHGKLPAGSHCRDCHTEHLGEHAPLTNLTNFDHDYAAFSLTGKHRSLDCSACHKTRSYREVARTCVGCHAEPKSHFGKFGTECASCHSTTSWHGAFTNHFAKGTFNHDRTKFPLTGKHRAVDCQSCHSGGTFTGTSTSCVSCHVEPKVPKVHRASYGSNCKQCHTTVSFKDTTFQHAFPVDHHAKGAKGAKIQPGNLCANCHNNPLNLAEYTCYNCHAHEPAKMRRRHSNRILGDVPLENCATCHKTGRRERRADAGEFGDEALVAWLLENVANDEVRFDRCDAALNTARDEENLWNWRLPPKVICEWASEKD